MDLKEIVSIMLLVDPVRWLLKTHTMKLSLIGEDKVTDQMVEEKINEPHLAVYYREYIR
jgi:hypothetical protein